jgi:crotonobetainyl-CoA:carnitine CoA-transferase CaiB-like acyl-CoA transferase
MGPLKDVRILDLTSVILGPYATQILASMGAEIIKVESPDGDNMRHVGPMKNPKMGHIFLHANRGKKSIVLDLKKSEGKKALLELAKTADVFISNIRPMALSRLGLGYENLKNINPRLIYVSCTGFGSDGLNADKPAYDDLIQAAIGIPWLMQQSGTKEPRYVPSTLGDRVTGLHCVYAVSSALYAREKTGQGQHIEVPMFEALTQFILGDHMAGESFVPAIGTPGYARVISPHRRPYETKDGFISILIYNDKHWKKFFIAIGSPEKINEEFYCSHTNRAKNIDFIYNELSNIIKTKTTKEWQDLLNKYDLPNQVVHSIKDLINDEHLKSKSFIATYDHPTEGKTRIMKDPIKWSGTPTNNDLSAAPSLGQHTSEILISLGYPQEAIQQIINSGAN